MAHENIVSNQMVKAQVFILNEEISEVCYS